MNPKVEVGDRQPRMIINEHIFPLPKIFSMLAEVSHDTWLRQREKHKGIPVSVGPAQVSEEDDDRAKAAWWALFEGKPKTKTEAVQLVAESSHQVWIGNDENKRSNMPNPNDHDTERARDLVEFLEKKRIIVFQ